MSFINELRRRNVLRVVLAYAAAAWVLTEVMDLVTGIYEAPTWVMKVLVGAVLIGVVPVMILSWVYQVTPEGVRKDDAVEPAGVPATGRQLNIAMVVMFAVAIGFFVAGRLSKDIGDEQVTTNDRPPMVAVLPFVSKSLEGDSEFFATGVHDDLLTQLAQLQSIRVISRTSVMEYRDTETNIREIGKALGADAILEGGVQSAGDRIRINAQLIDARTDEHLWAETYDRDLSLTSIFEVQTEIARAITSALKATMTEHDDEALAVIPTENMAAYRAYHRAKEIQNTKGSWLREEYREALEKAVALDPNFTRAWADLVQYLTHANYFFEHDPELTTRAEEILERIKTLAPDSADYLVAQSYYVYYVLKDYDQADQLVSQAHALRPSDTSILAVKSWIQRRQGDVDGRLETLRLMSTLDPRDQGTTQSLINSLMLTRQFEAARAELEQVDFDSLWLSFWNSLLHLREHRNLDRWADEVIALREEYGDHQDMTDIVWLAYVAKRDLAGAEELVSAMPEPDTSGGHAIDTYFQRLAYQIQVHWLLRQDEELADVLVAAREAIDEFPTPDGVAFDYVMNLDMALVTAAEGKTEETERRIWRLLNGAEKDLAARVLYLHEACWRLGMAGAAEAAVNCIRTGLGEPSYVMPFLEPYLPYYDAIREDPAFVALLAELGDEVSNP